MNPSPGRCPATAAARLRASPCEAGTTRLSSYRIRHSLLGACLAALLGGCGGGSVPSTGPSNSDLRPTGFAAPLTQAELDALPPEQQYQVANKLMGTLWRGVPVESFFDLNAGLEQPEVRRTAFLQESRRALSEPLPRSERRAVEAEIFGLDEEGNPDPELAKYDFDSDSDRFKQEPLARIVDYPVSRDMFAIWMAHFLANTIMFSPALEMESTDNIDAQRVISSLEAKIAEGQTIQEIVRGHLPSVSRWRVSRSAENHALEAYELYLGLFDTAEDSRKGGIACQNFYLTDEDEGYQLSQTAFVNTEPQVILDDYFVTTCSDLYAVIVSHPNFLPRVVEVIVNHLMSGASTEDRLAMVESIIDAGPETFEDVFKAILFSRAYLIDGERVQGMDENLFGTLSRLKWSAYTNRGELDDDIFRRMTERSNDRVHLDNAYWATMSYKIGRSQQMPTDALSFAHYHKLMREEVLFNNRAFDGRDDDYPEEYGLFYLQETEDLFTPLNLLSIPEFIDYVFLSGLQRRATDAERDAFIDTAMGRWIETDDDSGELEWRNENRADDFAQLMLDYMSRLPDFYYFRAIE